MKHIIIAAAVLLIAGCESPDEPYSPRSDIQIKHEMIADNTCSQEQMDTWKTLSAGLDVLMSEATSIPSESQDHVIYIAVIVNQKAILHSLVSQVSLLCDMRITGY